MPTDQETASTAAAPPAVIPGPQPLPALAEALPFALVSVLERRYLNSFAIDQWHLEGRPDDRARPLLRQVLALGRPGQPGSWGRAMPHVLTACHDPGHALMMVLHGHDGQHRLYLGGRRLPGEAPRSTEDYLEAQAGAFRAFFQGLELGPARSLVGSELPELTGLVARGQAMGLVTGIPSGRGGRQALDAQSLDRLVRAAGHHRYVLMVVAEPIDQEEIDAIVDRYRRLRSEIHAYIRTTQTRGTAVNRTVGRSEQRGIETPVADLPASLATLGLLVQFLGLSMPGARPLAGLIYAGERVGHALLQRETALTARQVTEGRSRSESTSVELLDAHAEACDRLLQRHAERLQVARAGGWWRTATYILGENEAALLAVGAALRAVAGGDQTDLDPLRLIKMPGSVLRPAIRSGQVWTMRPTGGQACHPLGESYEALGTCLDSDELAVLINLPQQEVPGIPVRDRSDFALTVPPAAADSVHLGWVQDPAGNDLAPVHLPADALNCHVFVTGITGSGKTNTCMQILLQADEALQVPFLVIEPAKTEYRTLTAADRLGGRLRVLSMHGPSPLRLNPLQPVPGIPLARHIDLLKAVFNASFPMFAGMAYVLEEALHEVYTERGWNLFNSSNPYLRRPADPFADGALTPTLGDVHDKIEVVLQRKQYGKEIHQNLGAALRSRLHSLTLGTKGLVLNTRRSFPPDELFGRPVVIELQELADDEEKAFVIALLFILLYEYAEIRQHHLTPERRERLQHLTLIEEAHRLLQAPRGPASAEEGDPRGKAVAMFTDMLAEMRALGEGFIVADQIPTKVAPEILKNSSVKIVHRLVAPDDRLAAGSCLNLSERQCRDLNNLTRGLALLHDERVGEAFLLRVKPVKRIGPVAGDPASARPDGMSASSPMRGYLLRHAGCRKCPAPCQFYHLLDQRLRALDLQHAARAFFQSLLAGEETDSRAAWQDWRAGIEPLLPAGPERRLGVAYCAVAQEAYGWLAEQFAAREGASGETSLSPEARLTSEALAADLAPLLHAWLTTDRDEPIRSAFETARASIKLALFSRPPRERAGCRNCPCRCERLLDVSPRLAKLAKVAEEVVLSRQPMKMRWTMIEQAISPFVCRATSKASPDVPDRLVRDWAYCLITNAPLAHGLEDRRQALLADLLNL